MMLRGGLVVCVVMASLMASLACGAQSAAGPRVVDLTAADGTALKGTFFAAEKPGPGVILLHQCNRQRKVWDDLSGQLAAAGINVMTLDFRGFGESAGKRSDTLSQQEYFAVVKDMFPGDVDKALEYLEAQPGVNRTVIGAGGASCGVNQAVQAARRHAEVKSLMLLSETTDREGRAFLRKSPKLPLFLAAADDDEDPGVVDVMEWLRDLSPDPSNKFVHHTNGGHGVVMFEAHKELPGMIVDWFATTLVKTPGSAPVTRKAGEMSAESRFLEASDEPGGAAKAVKFYEEERNRDAKKPPFSEVIVNRLGYDYLQQGDAKGAIEIFKLNTSSFPNSPNAYDSLGDAYLANGQKDLARESAKKSLELLATDTVDSQQRKDAVKQNAETKLK